MPPNQRNLNQLELLVDPITVNDIADNTNNVTASSNFTFASETMTANDVSANDNTNAFRCAILGCGMMGQEHISYIMGYLNDIRIDFLCDPFEPSLEKSVKIMEEYFHITNANTNNVGSKSNFRLPTLLKSEDDLLQHANDIDLLVIATPNYLHTDSILKWAKYDVTILVEKPVAVSYEQHQQLREKVLDNKDNDIKARIWVAMEYRYIPAIAKLLSLLPTIGEIKMITIRENRYPFLHKIGKWNRDRSKTGDTLVEKCCHFFDLFRLISNKEMDLKKVRAMAQRGLNYHDEPEYEKTQMGFHTPIIDSAYVVMPFKDNNNGAKEESKSNTTVSTIGCLELCMYAEGSRHQEEIIVTGTKGRLEAYLPENKVYSFERPCDKLWNDRSVPPPENAIRQTIYDCSSVHSVHGIDSEIHIPTHGGYHYSSTGVEWYRLLTAMKKFHDEEKESGDDNKHGGSDTKSSPTFVPEVSLEDGLRAIEIGLNATSAIVNEQERHL